MWPEASTLSIVPCVILLNMSALLEKLHLTSKSTKSPTKEPDAESLKELRKKYDDAEQGHVFHYYDELDKSGKAALYSQLSDIDPERVNEIVKDVLHPQKADKDDTPAKPEPLPESACASIIDSNASDVESWERYGLQQIAENKVGVVLMAGGQGTRLGSSAPKGCYNIGLPSEKSLFQLQAERIIRIQALAAQVHAKSTAVVPWYIMTSGPTRAPTEAFFQKNNYFGLQKENVLFFEQGVLPCVSNDGKILLEDKSKVHVLMHTSALTDVQGICCS